MALGLTVTLSLAGTVPTFAGQWIFDGSENWKWWYQNDDASYPKSDWKKIDEQWYHFDGNGYLDIGWKNIDGYFYHFQDSGAMDVSGKYETGAIQPDGHFQTYYYNGTVATNEDEANVFWEAKTREYGYDKVVKGNTGEYFSPLVEGKTRADCLEVANARMGIIYPESLSGSFGWNSEGFTFTVEF